MTAQIPRISPSVLMVLYLLSTSTVAASEKADGLQDNNSKISVIKGDSVAWKSIYFWELPDGFMSWTVVNRLTDTYDSTGNLTEHLHEYRDGIQYVYVVKYTYHYNSEGSLTEWLREGWDSTGWVTTKRYLYSYDTEGNLTEYIRERWKDNAWVTYKRYTYIYGTDGKMAESCMEEWEGSQWYQYRRYTYFYNAAGNLGGFFKEDRETDQWILFGKRTYTYDTAGNLIQCIDTDWDWDNAQWVDARKKTYVFGDNDNLTNYLYVIWDWDNSKWVNLNRTTCSYDSSGNLIEELEEHWHEGKWEICCRYRYTNDAGVKLTAKLVDNLDGNEKVPFVKTNGIMGVPSISVLITDSPVTLPIRLALLQNHPNPFNPASTIRYDLPQASEVSLTVYDILGREVVRLVDGYIEPGYHQVQWIGRDHSGLSVPTGIYIARLVTPEYTRSIKMLLLK